jgi:hypothetical protein
MELGTYDELERCEQLVADFVGKEAAMVIGMASVLPWLVAVNEEGAVAANAHGIAVDNGQFHNQQ